MVRVLPRPTQRVKRRHIAITFTKGVRSLTERVNVIYFTSCEARRAHRRLHPAKLGSIVTLEEIANLLDAEIISQNVDRKQSVAMACGADLMSDVLTFTHAGTLLLTGLTNPQVIRTADTAGISAIVFVRGKYPPPETISLAEEMNIPLLTSRYTMYECCGRLYKAGLPSCGLFDFSAPRQQGAPNACSMAGGEGQPGR